MTIYTFSEARQNFSSLLDKAREEGEVLIKRRDGSVFVVKPVLKALECIKKQKLKFFPCIVF